MLQTCNQCKDKFDQDAMVQFDENWVCAQCKTFYVQKLKEGVTPGSTSKSKDASLRSLIGVTFLMAVVGIPLAHYAYGRLPQGVPYPPLTRFFASYSAFGILVPVILFGLVRILQKLKFTKRKAVNIAEPTAIVLAGIWWGGCALAWFLSMPRPASL